VKDTFTTPEGYGSLLPAILLAASTGGAGAVGRTAAGPKSPISRVADYPTGTPPATRFPLKDLGKHAGFDREAARQLEVMKAPTMAEHIRSLDRAKQIEYLAKGKPYSIGKHLPFDQKNWHPDRNPGAYRGIQAYNSPEGFFFDVPKYQPKPDYFSGKKHESGYVPGLERAKRGGPVHSYAIPDFVAERLGPLLEGRGIQLPDQGGRWAFNSSMLKEHDSGGAMNPGGLPKNMRFLWGGR
jgi:hypothetical protein